MYIQEKFCIHKITLYLALYILLWKCCKYWVDKNSWFVHGGYIRMLLVKENDIFAENLPSICMII